MHVEGVRKREARVKRQREEAGRRRREVREAAAWTLVGGIFILQGFANVFNPGAAEQAMASFINLIHISV